MDDELLLPVDVGYAGGAVLEREEDEAVELGPHPVWPQLPGKAEAALASARREILEYIDVVLADDIWLTRSDIMVVVTSKKKYRVQIKRVLV